MTDNIDGDSFTDSARCLTYKLQCKDNKYLFLNSDGEFRLQHMTIQEQCQLGNMMLNNLSYLFEPVH